MANMSLSYRKEIFRADLEKRPLACSGGISWTFVNGVYLYYPGRDRRSESLKMRNNSRNVPNIGIFLEKVLFPPGFHLESFVEELFHPVLLQLGKFSVLDLHLNEKGVSPFLSAKRSGIPGRLVEVNRITYQPSSFRRLIMLVCILVSGFIEKGFEVRACKFHLAPHGLEYHPIHSAVGD